MDTFVQLLLVMIALGGLLIITKDTKDYSFLGQRWIFIPALVIACITGLHIVYMYLSSGHRYDGIFDWDYVFSFITNRRHDHFVIEVFVFAFSFLVGISGLQFSKEKKLQDSVKDLVRKALKDDV